MQNNIFKKRAKDADFLNSRIKINDKTSTVDFTKWLFDRIVVNKGDIIFDVGCGEGAQTIFLAKKTSPQGKVFALDISNDSISKLKAKLANNNLSNVNTIVEDMSNINDIINKYLNGINFDLIHSTYALYYSSKPVILLENFFKILKNTGRLIIFVPYKPHGLIEYIKLFKPIPPNIDESLNFGPRILEPFFRRNFMNNTVHFFCNKIKIVSINDFIEFYRATTYYDKEIESELIDDVSKIISSKGYFEYEKNGYLIIGNEKK